MLWLFLTLTLQKAAKMTLEFAPYVIVGVVFGEALRYTPATRWLERVCRRSPLVAITLSSLFGAASPLCTYGTIPVVLHLLRGGVPLAPLGAFLATSSLINPQLLFITWGGLGQQMALAELACVIGFGLLLGTVLHLVPDRYSVQPLLRAQPEKEPRGPLQFTWKGFATSCWRTLQFVGFYLLLGIFLGAAVEVVGPGRWLVWVFGANRWVQVLAAGLLGLPLYACGGGAIPLLSSLIREGLDPGAALAFLMAGPATRMAPLMALATLMRSRVVVMYVVGLLVYSVAVGLLYGLL